MKKIWIFNHYATNTFEDRAGRHYSFAKELIKRGYDVTLFCASTVHNTDHIMETESELYGEKTLDTIPYVFIKTPPYSGNGKSRIVNMLTFAKNMKPVATEYLKKHGKPDVIIASSVHPFTCVAGIKLAKKLNVPCIAEIRDLWPESIVAYTDRENTNPAVKLLYRMEKWIYENADKIIFTMEGGKDYIAEKGWDTTHGGKIDLSKVYHINNGVDLELFDDNCKNETFQDTDLDNPDVFKVVYTGSVRKVNNLKALVDAADKAKAENLADIKFIIFGDGDEREALANEAAEKNLDNIVFKGKIPKSSVPYALSKADVNIIHVEQTPIMRFGCSLNKLFEYLASGKPVVSDLVTGYDIIEKNGCGIVTKTQSPADILKAISKIRDMTPEEYAAMCNNSRSCAESYDFSKLTDDLITVIGESND